LLLWRGITNPDIHKFIPVLKALHEHGRDPREVEGSSKFPSTNNDIGNQRIVGKYQTDEGVLDRLKNITRQL
jgi:hypothetical protein